MESLDVFDTEYAMKRYAKLGVGIVLIIVGIVLLFEYIFDFMKIFLGLAFVIFGIMFIIKNKAFKNFRFFKF